MTITEWLIALLVWKPQGSLEQQRRERALVRTEVLTGDR
jgi:hypothetical protein